MRHLRLASLLPHSRIKEKPTRLGLGSELESVDHGFESTIAATSSVSRDLRFVRLDR
jgi:hypothetical protein